MLLLEDVDEVLLVFFFEALEVDADTFFLEVVVVMLPELFAVFVVEVVALVVLGFAVAGIVVLL